MYFFLLTNYLDYLVFDDALALLDRLKEKQWQQLKKEKYSGSSL